MDRNKDRNRKAKKPVKPGREERAPVDEFEREGMGVAPKE